MPLRYVTSPAISPFLRLANRDNRPNHNKEVIPGRWNFIMYERADKVTTKLSGLIIAVERDICGGVYAWHQIEESLSCRGLDPSQFAVSSLWMSPGKLDS